MQSDAYHAIVALLVLCACGRSRADVRVEATSPSSSAAGDALASPSLRPSSAADLGSKVTLRGSYNSAAGDLYIPPDWKGVRWSVQGSDAGVGEGTMSLTIDPVTSRVGGTLDGPLGLAIINGFSSDGKVTATVARKDPADRGFTGTLVASNLGERVEGTIHVSLPEAEAIRTVTFTLSPSGATAR
jgi:hypothetical protein